MMTHTRNMPAAIGPTWQDCEAAICAAARHLGYRRTGRLITTTLKSALNGAIRRGLLDYESNMIRKSR